MAAPRNFEPDGQVSMAGGQHDLGDPSEIPEDRAVYLKNVELRGAQLFKSRRGQRTVCSSPGSGSPQGGGYYEQSEGNGFIVYVHNGKIYYWSGSGTAPRQIGTTQLANRTKPVDFSAGYTAAGKRMFLAPGEDDDPYTWNGDPGQAFQVLGSSVTNTNMPRCDILVPQNGWMVSNNKAVRDSFYVGGDDRHDDGKWNQQLWNARLTSRLQGAMRAGLQYRDFSVLGFTAGTIHELDVEGDDPQVFPCKIIDHERGTQARYGPILAREDVIFPGGDKHFWSMVRNENNQIRGVAMPISYLNPNMIDRINPYALDKVAGVYFDNYALFAVPMDGAAGNTSVIAFDFFRMIEVNGIAVPICVGEWTGLRVLRWIKARFAGKERLFYIDNTDGAIHEFLANEMEENDWPTVVVETRGFTNGSERHDKSIHSGELIYRNTFGALSMEYQGDDEVWRPGKSAFISSGSPSLPIPALPFDLANPTDGKFRFSMYKTGRSRRRRFRFTHYGGPITASSLILASHMETLNTRN